MKVDDLITDKQGNLYYIISLLHCFAMRMYSARRKKKITLVEEDLTNEISL